MVEAGYGHGFESGRWHPHSLENMVAINAGGKKLGMKLGQHINAKEKHPVTLLNTAMRTMGVSNPQVGKVKGFFPELIA